MKYIQKAIESPFGVVGDAWVIIEAGVNRVTKRPYAIMGQYVNVATAIADKQPLQTKRYTCAVEEMDMDVDFDLVEHILEHVMELDSQLIDGTIVDSEQLQMMETGGM